MDNELYDICYTLKGFETRPGYKVVKAEKIGDQWTLVIEKEKNEKVVADDND